MFLKKNSCQHLKTGKFTFMSAFLPSLKEPEALVALGSHSHRAASGLGPSSSSLVETEVMAQGACFLPSHYLAGQRGPWSH